MSPLSIFKNSIDLDEYHGKYLEYIHQTSLRDSYESHFHAAFYAPVLFLKGVKSFESTFNQILFHLENAYDKAETETAQRGILISMQWLLDFHVDAIETGIEVVESKLKASLHSQIWESIQGVLVEIFSKKPNGGVIVAEIGKLFNEYYIYLTNKKTIEKYEVQFYPQLLHVYSKVLNSKIYSSNHGLIINSFMGVKNRQSLIAHAIQEKGLAITLNMLRQFDMPKRDFGESLRMLVQNLAIVSPLPAAEDLMKLIDLFREEDVPNRSDLERETIKFYQHNVIPAVLLEYGVTDTLETLGESSLGKKDFGYSLRIMISKLDIRRVAETDLIAIMKFANEQRLLNQEETKKDLIHCYKKNFKPETPDISMLISIGLIFGFFIWIGLIVLTANAAIIITFLILLIFAAILATPVASIYQEVKFDQRVKKFVDELDLVSK